MIVGVRRRDAANRTLCVLFGAISLMLSGVCLGQTLSPISDPVHQSLMPTGVSERSVSLEGPLASVFKDNDGTDVIHIVGDFTLRLGDDREPTMRAREAVVWLEGREFQGRAYQHVQIMLWRQAEIEEIAGTITSAPALFATLNTFGEILANVDNVAFESIATTLAYREGDEIRRSLSRVLTETNDQRAALTIFDVSGSSSVSPTGDKPSLIQIRSDGEMTLATTSDGDDVMVVRGGVYVSRGAFSGGEALEIRADSVVIFLPPKVDDSTSTDPNARDTVQASGLGVGMDARSRRPQRRSSGDASEQDDSAAVGLGAAFGGFEVQAAYLEGDVVMSQGVTMVRADRLYYDLFSDRALILDAVVRTTLVERNVPLYLRAAEIKQLSRSSFSASDAVLTTSSFHTPHYHVGAEVVELRNLVAADQNRTSGVVSGTYRLRRSTLNIGGQPILYWPYMRGNLDASETAVRGLRSGFSGDFGLEFQTDWHLFNVLGLETPEGFDANLSLDFFSRRGPAAGVDATYERDTYYGLMRSYFLADRGRDNLGRQRERLSEHSARGRALIRHRQYLEDDWEVTLELSYISDEGFLEEFFEREFDNDKEQETLLYLKKQRDTWAVTATLQYRILDFTSQTERLPDFAYHVIGRPVADGLTWYSENRFGFVRRRGKDQTRLEQLRDGRAISSGTVTRVDTRHELGAPVDVGPVRFVPFASVRGSVWDDGVDGSGVQRALGTVGVRGSAYLSRVYPELESAALDVSGLRHVIKADVVTWAGEANRDSDDLFPFDQSVEGVEDSDGVAIGVRQRLQTKRGPEGNRRNVDVLTHDMEVGFFNGARRDEITNGFVSFSRPENSISQNYVNSSLVWRVNDRTALASELNYDINDREIDVLNVSVAVERSPRMSYVLLYRFLNESNSNLLGFDTIYKFTEKHSIAIRELFDLSEGQTLDFTVALIRKFPRWFGAVSFALDEAENDFGVSFSLWPEGLGKATLGSRRFTGIANMERMYTR